VSIAGVILSSAGMFCHKHQGRPPRPPIRLQNSLQVLHRPVFVLGKDKGNPLGDGWEWDFSFEESPDQNLVCGVGHRRRGTAFLPRRENHPKRRVLFPRDFRKMQRKAGELQRDRRGQSLRICEGSADRDAHIGRGHLRKNRAIPKLYKGVHHAFWVQ